MFRALDHKRARRVSRFSVAPLTRTPSGLIARSRRWYYCTKALEGRRIVPPLSPRRHLLSLPYIDSRSLSSNSSQSKDEEHGRQLSWIVIHCAKPHAFRSPLFQTLINRAGESLRCLSFARLIHFSGCHFRQLHLHADDARCRSGQGGAWRR